jgi:hypothetical protein
VFAAAAAMTLLWLPLVVFGARRMVVPAATVPAAG